MATDMAAISKGLHQGNSSLSGLHAVKNEMLVFLHYILFCAHNLRYKRIISATFPPKMAANKAAVG